MPLLSLWAYNIRFTVEAVDWVLPSTVNIPNAFGVTVDDLLRDSLVQSKAVFERDAANILADCTHRELMIIIGTMRVLK